MARYIDAELLKNEIENTYLVSKDRVLDIILEQPTADVEEVRHGHWDYCGPLCDGKGIYDVWRCSKCMIPNFKRPKFCPNCRAKMDGEE